MKSTHHLHLDNLRKCKTFKEMDDYIYLFVDIVPAEEFAMLIQYATFRLQNEPLNYTKTV